MTANNEQIHISALFSDETESFRIPIEPEPFSNVTVRFRTMKENVDFIYLVEDKRKLLMKKAEEDSIFDYYEIELKLGGSPMQYYFEIHKGAECLFYNKLGVSEDLSERFLFRIIPGMNTPKWARGAVFYQIFVDRFCNGDPTNDVEDREYLYIKEQGVEKVADWDRYPAEMDVRSFYGGDLQGVWDKLDYIQGLGVDVIYFNPLFVSPSNHKYDIQDYDYIDPHLGLIVKDGGDSVPAGDRDNRRASKYMARCADRENLEASNKFFADLVQEIHRRGMRVVLDGVFNHCGSFNKWMDREQIYEQVEGYEKGAYISEDSPYRNYFTFNGGSWPYNGEYDGWWDHATLPKLNYEESDELYRYVMKVAGKWVSPPYDADGWRLDVAADLGYSEDFNHRFWRDFRRSVKSAKKDAIILAEHYGDPSPWLMGDQWDTVMNYDAFMEPVTWFLTGMEKHSDDYNEHLLNNASAFFHSMLRNMCCFSVGSLQTAMNELSNHDHSRFLTRTNRLPGRIQNAGPRMAEQGVNKAILREAVLIQMTWPGAPTIYYGDETGVCGWTDPDSRRTYPWGREDFELIEFHRYIIRIHKISPALRLGSVKPLAAEHGLIAYGRFCKEEGDNNRMAVVINNTFEDRRISIPVWEIGVTDDEIMERIIYTNERGYNMGKIDLFVCDGKLTLDMEKTSGMVLRVKP